MSRTATLVSGVLVLLLALAPAAGAQSGKVVEVDIGGDAVAGSTTTFSLTFTNPAGAQTQVGSANVTTPFTLVAPAGAGNTVQLRNLSLQPGQSVTFSITAAVPCGYSGSGTWTIVAKQANNFNGPPGNNVLAIGDLTTPVTGECGLAFGTQPAKALVGAVISGADYNPAGPAVTVIATDGAGAPRDVMVTMSLAPGFGFGPLGGLTSLPTEDGVAEFSTLTIGSPGLYSLQASAPGSDPVFSASFSVDEGVACKEDVVCTDTATTGRSELTLTGLPNGNPDAGVLRLAYDVGLELDCVDYKELTIGTAVFDVTGGRAKTAVLEIDKKEMQAQANNGASFLQMCFAAPDPFPTRTGTAVVDGSFDWDGDGAAEPVYKGLLRDCGAPPCVSKRQKNGAGDGIITVQLPPGDPGMRG